MPDYDDEIVDAEIVDDDSLLPDVIGGPALEGFHSTGSGMAPHHLPPGSVLVELTFQQRQVIRAALAWYHDKGPRERRTSEIMAVMNYVADHEEWQNCATCDNTGKYRTMYEMHFCNCPRGMARRRANGG